MATLRETQKTEAITRLQELLKSGSTVYTDLKHVSRSGMQRAISVHVVDSDGDIFDISWLAARALDYRIHARGGLKVNGCGMDMGFHVVYGLSQTVLGDGYALKHRWI